MFWALPRIRDLKKALSAAFFRFFLFFEVFFGNFCQKSNIKAIIYNRKLWKGAAGPAGTQSSPNSGPSSALGSCCGPAIL